MTTLGELFAARARVHAVKTLLVDGAATHTYGSVAQRARSVAAWLHMNVQRGENAALLLPSGAGFAAAFFGAQLAGVAVLTIDPRLKQSGGIL